MVELVGGPLDGQRLEVADPPPELVDVALPQQPLGVGLDDSPTLSMLPVATYRRPRQGVRAGALMYLFLSQSKDMPR